MDHSESGKHVSHWPKHKKKKEPCAYLSLCSLSLLSTTVPFCRRPSTAVVHSPDQEKEQLSVTSWLKFHRQIVSNVSYRRHMSSSSRSSFGHFLAISGELSSQLHHFWTQRSKTYPPISIILGESQIFYRGSTINLWLSDHFLAKQR